MKKIKLALIGIILLAGIAGILGSISIAHGQSTVGDKIIKQLQEGAGANGANLPAPKDPRLVAANIIRVLLGLLGTIFVVLIVYAGFLWMTAGGNEENVKKAKGYIFNAIIGLCIVLSAYGITFFAFKLGLSSYGDRCNSDANCSQKKNSGGGPGIQMEKCSRYGMCVDSYWCEVDVDCNNLGNSYVCRNSGCTTAKDLGDGGWINPD